MNTRTGLSANTQCYKHVQPYKWLCRGEQEHLDKANCRSGIQWITIHTQM